MTPAWWKLELEIQNKKHSQKAEVAQHLGTSFFTIFNKSIISILGLNLIPIEEEDGTLRAPRDDEITPLMLGCAQKEFLAAAFEKMEKFQQQEEALKDVSDESSFEEDLEFLDDLDNELGHAGKSDKQIIWESAEVQDMVHQLVQVDDEIPPPDNELNLVFTEPQEARAEKRKKPTIEIDEELGTPDKD